MKVGPLFGFVFGLAAGAAQAASPPYCDRAPPANGKPAPICADAKLRAIEGELAKAFEAARDRLAASPALAAALEQDETRFLAQRDAIVANLAKVDPYNRKEKEEFHDPAGIMRKRIALLSRIDGAPRKTLRGQWGGADGYLFVNERDRGLFISLLANRKQLGLDAVEDWLCRGMGETRGKIKQDAPRISATLYRGDGEGLPARGVDIRSSEVMAKVSFLLPRNRRAGDATPVCEGAAKVAPARLFPLKEAQ
jgi:uncharacterized protein YecT (DUF1311 family)